DGARFGLEQIGAGVRRKIRVVVVPGDGAPVLRSTIFAGVPHYRKPRDGDELLGIVARYATPALSPPRQPADANDVRIEIRPEAPSAAGRLRGRRGRRWQTSLTSSARSDPKS